MVYGDARHVLDIVANYTFIVALLGQLSFSGIVFSSLIVVECILFIYCHIMMCSSVKRDTTIPMSIKLNPAALYTEESYLTHRGKLYRKCAILHFSLGCLLLLVRLIL